MVSAMTSAQLPVRTTPGLLLAPEPGRLRPDELAEHPQPGRPHFTREILVSDFDKLVHDFDEALAEYVQEHRKADPSASHRLKLLLQYADFLRGLLEEFLKFRPPAIFDRVFGGDCHRAAHLVALLDNVAFASQRLVLTDTRWKNCRAVVELVCEILKKLGYAEQLEKAIFLESKFVRSVLLKRAMDMRALGAGKAAFGETTEGYLLPNGQRAQHPVWVQDAVAKNAPPQIGVLNAQARTGLEDLRRLLRRMLFENSPAYPDDPRDVQNFPSLPSPQELMGRAALASAGGGGDKSQNNGDPSQLGDGSRGPTTRSLLEQAKMVPGRPEPQQTAGFDWWQPAACLPAPQFTVHDCNLYLTEEEKHRREQLARGRGAKGKGKGVRHWALPHEHVMRAGVDDVGSDAEYDGYAGRWKKRQPKDFDPNFKDRTNYRPFPGTYLSEERCEAYVAIVTVAKDPKQRREKVPKHREYYPRTAWWEGHRKAHGRPDVDVPYEEDSDVEQIDVIDHGGKVTAYRPGEHLALADFHATTSNMMKARLAGVGGLDDLEDIPPPDQATTPGDWAYYQVRRLQCNDQKLERLVFDGMTLPLADQSSLLPDLIQGLARNTHLELLSLANCELPPLFGMALANVFKTNKTLREVNLEGNQFDVVALMAIAEGLKENDVLERLSLTGNPGNKLAGGYQGVETSFMNMLVENRALTHLGITTRDPTMRKKIDDALLHNAHRWRHPLETEQQERKRKKKEREEEKEKEKAVVAPAWTMPQKQGDKPNEEQVYAARHPAWTSPRTIGDQRSSRHNLATDASQDSDTSDRESPGGAGGTRGAGGGSSSGSSIIITTSDDSIVITPSDSEDGAQAGGPKSSIVITPSDSEDGGQAGGPKSSIVITPSDSDSS